MATSIPSLLITVTTGDDDLRGDSSCTAFVQVGAALVEYSITMKASGDGSWDNGSTHGPFTLLMAAGITTADIKKFGIKFTSNSGVFQTHDNWNVNSVSVTYLDSAGGETVFIELSGDPLFRLTGDTTAWGTTNFRA